jgi:hypothetical protein
MQRLPRSKHYGESSHGDKVNDVKDNAADNDKEDGVLTRASEDSVAASLLSRRETGSDPQVQCSQNDGQSNLKTRLGGGYYTW